MKSTTTIAIVVLIALVLAGIFLFPGPTEEIIAENTGGLIVTEYVKSLETSDDVFNTIDDALQVLE